ncbi:ERAP1-like C-terminal domain-containing protein, partial [Candidatus Nomurabacteria bacterium]|nr:ERAP1-like C-terminal domain-containing protein [Candidatus Nomurabacteria bacterium]
GKILAKTDVKKGLDKLTIELFSPTLSRLGWNKKNKEKNTDALLRSLTISMLGEAGDKKVIAEAKKRFSGILKGAHVDPDIRGAVYRIAMLSGGLKEYQALVARYKKEHLHEEKNRIGNALGHSQNPKVLKLLCEFALSKNVRPQDTVGILSSVGVNPMGRDIWWNFIVKNWKTMVSRYGEGGLTLGRAVQAISSSAEEKHFKSFKAFFKTHEAPGAKRAIEQVLERLEGNILWLKRDRKNIERFLK